MTLPPHGGQLRLLAQSLGLRDPERILDFSANINPDGPPPSVLAALRKALEDPATLSTYPDLELHELRTALARHLGLSLENIVAANGFAPLLEATLRARKVNRCLLPVPAFPEYRATLTRAGAATIPLPLNPVTFAYDPAAILQAFHQHRPDALLLANPQNPSGVLTPTADLLNLFDQLPRTVTILLDEAFIDYAPAHTLTRAQFPNLVVFRSLTKFFAIPGLRIAYATTAPPLATAIRQQLPPWPISRLAEIAAATALADKTYSRSSLTANHQRRERLRTSLAELGIHTLPAAANFLLLPLPTLAEPIWSALLHTHQILLRHTGNFESLPPNHLRTAVRTEAENDRLVQALQAVLRLPQNPSSKC